VLLHSALTRLPADWSRAAKEKQVDTVIDVLSLGAVADNFIGNELRRGVCVSALHSRACPACSTRYFSVAQLSGGQKKRVSIGVELVAKPLVLFCDEPTSGARSCAPCPR
jgi:ABC-type glutathione transport system ATPase component